jgi:hypothetical protein
MKKLLLPFEGGHYPQELLEFVSALQPMDPVLLTAAFVPESKHANLVGAREWPVSAPLSCYGDEDRMIRYNSKQLEQFCKDSGIRLKIRENKEEAALPCLRKESRYADLLLLDSRHFFADVEQSQPNAWISEMLHRSECPVLLLSEKTALPGELILTYDGSAESVFAIRQFAYLFPEFCRIQATLVYVNEDPDAKIPEEESIRELCALHFKKFRVLKLQLRSEEFYHTWVAMMSNPWLVSGSFGRPALSQLFSTSFSMELIREHQVPVFIAHK